MASEKPVEGGGGGGGGALDIPLITIGDSSVGKSCLLMRFADDRGKLKDLSKSPLTTIGIDYKNKFVDIDGKRVKLQIWDTAGQERFRTLTVGYYRKSQGILLVYDVTNRESFVSVRAWMKQIEQHADVGVSKLLVGNKSDLSSQRVVTYEEGEALANEFHMPFFEASAQTNQNVTQAFMKLASDVKTRLETGHDPNSASGKLAAFGSPGGKILMGTEDGGQGKPARKSWC